MTEERKQFWMLVGAIALFIVAVFLLAGCGPSFERPDGIDIDPIDPDKPFTPALIMKWVGGVAVGLGSIAFVIGGFLMWFGDKKKAVSLMLAGLSVGISGAVLVWVSTWLFVIVMTVLGMGLLLGILAVWLKRKAIVIAAEKWANEDFNRDGFIGKAKQKVISSATTKRITALEPLT